MQIADLDRSAPPSATARAAIRARAEIRHYPCDHFYVLSGHWRDVAVADQLAFVSRIVTAPAPPDSE